jgi:hypothetical protein
MKGNRMMAFHMGRITESESDLPQSDANTVSRKHRRIAMSSIARLRRQIRGADYQNDLANADPWAIALRDFMAGIDNLTDKNEIARRYGEFQRHLQELQKGGAAQ